MSTIAEDTEEEVVARSKRRALSWHVWAFLRNICLLLMLAPQRSPRVLSISADPSSLIYSLFYLYVWSKTLSEQMIEGISPR